MTRQKWCIVQLEETSASTETVNESIQSMNTNAATVADKIESSHATVKVVCQEGGGHCEADWEKLVPGFMNFLWMGEN